MAMSLSRLDVLIHVVDAGSISAAARALYMTQPAVSSHIRTLESSLGVQLLERRPNGTVPTPAGDAVVSRARAIFEILDEIEHAAAEFQGLRAGRLSVAGTTTVGTYLLPRLIAQFTKKVPSVTCQIRVGNEETVESWLVEGEIGIGLAIGTPVSSRLEAQPVLSEETRLVVSPDSPLAGIKAGADDLAGQRFLLREAGSATRRLQEETLAAWGLAEAERWDLWGPDTVKEAARNGLGVALMPEHAVSHELAWGTLARVDTVLAVPTRTISLLRRRDRVLTPPERAFVDLILALRAWPT